MGWALRYRNFEIYPALVPRWDEQKGVVGFQPIAHVQRCDTDGMTTPFVEIPVDRGVIFEDPSEASEYVVDRAKRMIDASDH